MKLIRSVVFVFILIFSWSVTLLSQKELLTEGQLNTINSELSLLSIPASEVEISSSHTTDHNGVTHVYLQQTYDELDIHGAVANLVVRDKVEVAHVDRLVVGFQSRIAIPSKSRMAIEDVIQKVARHLNLPFEKSNPLVHQLKNGIYELEGLPYALGKPTMTPIWVPSEAGQYQKGWRIELSSKLNSDIYTVITDSQQGEVLEVLNHTISCRYDEAHDHSPVVKRKNKSEIKNLHTNFIGEGTYNVFAVPLESPNHGVRSKVENPADPQASPFGWHDADGVEGAEFTITRGNNVHAYQDINANNDDSNDEPDGDELLIFDFPFEQGGSVEVNLDADVTNLFYWNNYLHDWTYQFGFNESAGNFQLNNYSKGGEDGDYVLAETLDGSDTGNATFSISPDGVNGRMQMHRWVIGGDFGVTSPGSISGTYQSTAANFGPLNKPRIEGSLRIAMDDVNQLGDVCEPINNSAEISGHVALVDRGICDFSFKTFQVQQAGAIACIVCNDLDNAPLVSMGAGDDAEKVTIPAIFLSKEDCQILKDQINEDQDVSITIAESRQVSSAFDNGIVAHEYTHGISSRLVGGRNTSGCLSNDEQMGEGWSDFFALVLTQRSQDQGAKARPIGTYALGEAPTGSGIRRYPYSTDMSVNPQVHSHIRRSSTPHPVGEIWASALWDMYWLFIDKYDYDPSWNDRSSGNYLAMQVVIDGMKIQRCDGSLLDARNALITADAVNNLGENRCLIWEAFARRGMGIDADGGNANWRYDNIDGFQTPSFCDTEPSISRKVTSTVDAGGLIQVELSFNTQSVALSDFSVIDVVPSLDGGGVSFANVSTPGVTAEVNGDRVIFDLRGLPSQSTNTISYNLKTRNVVAPDFEVFENFEGQPAFSFSRSESAVENWTIIDSNPSKGKFAMAVAGNIFEGDAYATIVTPIPIVNNNKILKFDHRYDSQLGFDGGVVEISKDNGSTWDAVQIENVLIDPYPEVIAYDRRYVITESSYSGSDTLWKSSIVDLTEYAAEEIQVRFKYVQQDFLEIEAFKGWAIDNFEVLDRLELKGQACLLMNGSELACDEASTFVNSNAGTTSINEVLLDRGLLSIVPNPASAQIEIKLESELTSDALVRIIATDGKVIQIVKKNLRQGLNSWKQDVSNLADGVYILEIRSEAGIVNQKFIKQ